MKTGGVGVCVGLKLDMMHDQPFKANLVQNVVSACGEGNLMVNIWENGLGVCMVEVLSKNEKAEWDE